LSKLKVGDKIQFIKEYQNQWGHFPIGFKAKLIYAVGFNVIPYPNSKRSGLIADAMFNEGYIKVITRKYRLPLP
jgi:hypothetical protein